MQKEKSERMPREFLTIPGAKPLKGWARIPDDQVVNQRFEAMGAPVWCPLVSKETVDASIRLSKRSGEDSFQDCGCIGRFDSGMYGIANDFNVEADWILSVDERVLLVGNERDRLRDVFDHQYRWQLIRPPALKLVPDVDDIHEILSNVVHIKDATTGDLVFRYHLGPVLDVAMIRTVNKTRTKFEIFGDSLTFVPGDFVPPTKQRKEEFQQGIKKLAAPIATAIATPTDTPAYPEIQSTFVPGRPSLTFSVDRVSRSGDYVWVNFAIYNQGTETVNWLHYQYARETNAPKEAVPFAYQNNTRYSIYSVNADGSGRVLYPGTKERIAVSIGRNVGPGELKLFIPAYFFAGFYGCYFMLSVNLAE